MPPVIVYPDNLAYRRPWQHKGQDVPPTLIITVPQWRQQWVRPTPYQINWVLYWNKTAQVTNATAGIHEHTWVARPLSLPQYPAARLLYFNNRTAQDSSVPPPPDHPQHWVARFLRPGLNPAYIFHQAEDVSSPPEEAGLHQWVPRYVNTPVPSSAVFLSYRTSGSIDSAIPFPDVPPWQARFIPTIRYATQAVWSLYYQNYETSFTAWGDTPYWVPPPVPIEPPTINKGLLWNRASDESSSQNQEMGRSGWQPTPLNVPKPYLPTVSQFYLTENASDFSNVTTPPSDLGWRPPDRVKQFTPPSGMSLYYYNNIPTEIQGQTPEVGRDTWRAQYVQVNQVPKVAFSLYQQGVADVDVQAQAPLPVNFILTRVQLTQVPRMAFVLYMQSNTAQDLSEKGHNPHRVSGLINEPRWPTIIR